jgi:hypothetical protein
MLRVVIPFLYEMLRIGEFPSRSSRASGAINVPGWVGSRELRIWKGIPFRTSGVWVAGWSTLAPKVASSAASSSDTCTPAIAANRVFATAYGELFCLDLATGLKTLWQHDDDMFHDHCNIIASPDRLLFWTANGDLLLLDAKADAYAPLAKLRPFEDKHPDTLAHPAIVGDRIYLRSSNAVACFKLSAE